MEYWNITLLISIITLVGLAVITLLVGRKIWKNLIVTLIISTLISFLVLCALNFLSGYGIHVPWNKDNYWLEILNLEMSLMSLVIGGVITFIIMLGTLIAKNNR
ncbi:hypothetical protein [Acinetobacter lwoffii]|jgi:purine-cytosine permease-like protein|uniref:hypothetical protein n=1 Tax=Acinetobacter lwoffii TaxID=28090 RepID=UPI0020981C76|nr:hypothetical protein [Acinetobacter lwoffii]MCO8083648.1 hypothetical protein [Acinetobacter lwoffii]